MTDDKKKEIYDIRLLVNNRGNIDERSVEQRRIGDSLGNSTIDGNLSVDSVLGSSCASEYTGVLRSASPANCSSIESFPGGLVTQGVIVRKKEIGGRKGSEPTRYGDWERAGRCIDF